jgi:hypothetical protein
MMLECNEVALTPLKSMDESNESPRSADCCDWRKTVDDLSARTADFVREDPAKAVGLALLGGVLLTVLPVGRVVGALVRLAFALARPLLLVLGGIKLYEEFDKTRKS